MALSKFSLDGKVALITGASGLLGQEHAYALLEAGAVVVLTDISPRGLEDAKIRLSESFGVKSIIVKTMDVTSKSNIRFGL